MLAVGCCGAVAFVLTASEATPSSGEAATPAKHAFTFAVPTNRPLFAPDTRRIRHVIVPLDGYDADDPE